MLKALLERARTGGTAPAPPVDLSLQGNPQTIVRASVGVDPASGGFLLALT